MSSCIRCGTLRFEQARTGLHEAVPLCLLRLVSCTVRYKRLQWRAGISGPRRRSTVIHAMRVTVSDPDGVLLSAVYRNPSRFSFSFPATARQSP